MLTFLKRLAASVPVPATDKVTVFVEDSTGEPSYKDDAGTVISLKGAPGLAGEGVPTGGTAGQVLRKIDGADYNTEWASVAGGVSSVNGDIGAVIVTVPIGIACSDETTAITTGTAKATFRMPFAMTLTDVRASLTTAQATSGAGGLVTVDINEAGASILSTKITIDNTEKTSTTAATPPVISDTSLADDSEITIDIDQIGDGTAKGLKVWLIGYPT